VSFKSPMEAECHISRCRIVWHVVPHPWADNRKNPFGWRQLSTWTKAL